MAQVLGQERDHLAADLQVGDIGVAVEAVQAIQVERDVAVQDVVDGHHRRHMDHPTVRTASDSLQDRRSLRCGITLGILGGLRRSLTGEVSGNREWTAWQGRHALRVPLGGPRSYVLPTGQRPQAGDRTIPGLLQMRPRYYSSFSIFVHG